MLAYHNDPETIAHLEDAIFEGLTTDLAKQWPARFLAAIEPGADLSRVWHRFASWLLTDSGLLTTTDGNREAIVAVASLHTRAAAGETVSPEAWTAAAAAAAARAESAWAARAARAAAAAQSARAAAWQKMADKLIELLAESD